MSRDRAEGPEIKKKKQTTERDPKMIEVTNLELSVMDFKITMINIFKKLYY